MKSERTIMVRSDFIAVHRSTMDVDRCPAMPLLSLVAVASLSDEGRQIAMLKDVGRCTTMEVWTHHKSPLVLKWRNINGTFRLHRCTSVSEYLCTQRGWPRAKGHVGWCKAIEVWMHNTTIFRFQGPPFWHENYRSTPSNHMWWISIKFLPHSGHHVVGNLEF